MTQLWQEQQKSDYGGDVEHLENPVLKEGTESSLIPGSTRFKIILLPILFIHSPCATIIFLSLSLVLQIPERNWKLKI